MNVYEATTKRRTIRKYQNKPVPYEVLERCVDAGRLAPCGMNNQFLEYMVVDGEQKLPEVLACLSMGGKRLDSKESPPPSHYPKACIIPLINTALEAEISAPRTGIMCEVGMSAENIILVALENGVGVCPVMMFDESELKKVLKIPDKYEVAIVMTLGYPDESPIAEESTGSVKVWVDNQGARHIPKRKLTDILHHNGFPK
jgi:nitroreductase